MLCSACRKTLADEFGFCPYCGNPVDRKSTAVETPDSSADPRLLTDVPRVGLSSGKGPSANGGVQVGTIVFAAFAAISLVVSVIKGLVPIYFLEAVGWAGLAWYWQTRRHSELARAIVGTLAVVVALGEVIHISTQWDSQPAPVPVANATAVYPSTNNVDAQGFPIVGRANSTTEPPTPPLGFVPDAPPQNATPTPSRKVADNSLPEINPPVVLAECPPSVPSGAKSRPLPKYASEMMAGKQFGNLSSEKTYNSLGEDYLSWNFDLDFTNNANTCVVMAIIEVELSYRGRISRERHTIAFAPLLGPHKNQSLFSTVKLDIRTSERGEPPVLTGWRTTGVAGFELRDDSAPLVQR